MTSLWPLPTFAALLAACAAGLAALRGLERARALADSATAIGAAVVGILAGVSSYARAAQLSDGAAWRNAGALCFMAFPLVSTVALSLTARKRRWPKGSVFGSILGGGLTVTLVWAWATLYLKGVRGGWTPVEVVVCVASVGGALPASACLGWWCGRNLRQKRA